MFKTLIKACHNTQRRQLALHVNYSIIVYYTARSILMSKIELFMTIYIPANHRSHSYIYSSIGLTIILSY